MMADRHEKARSLIDAAGIEGIAGDEQRWLNGHLSGCVECAGYAELSRRAAATVRGFAFEVDAAAALEVSAAVRWELDRLAERRRIRGGVAAALGVTVAGSLLAWLAAAWWAARANIPAGIWQPAFAVVWVLPSLLLIGVLLMRAKFQGDLQ